MEVNKQFNFSCQKKSWTNDYNVSHDLMHILKNEMKRNVTKCNEMYGLFSEVNPK